MEAFSALVPAEFTRLRELRIALAAWLERRAVERRAREAAVLATHEAAAAAIRNQWQSIRITATLTESTLAVELTCDRPRSSAERRGANPTRTRAD